MQDGSRMPAPDYRTVQFSSTDRRSTGDDTAFEPPSTRLVGKFAGFFCPA
jgi:hypothetical protein